MTRIVSYNVLAPAFLKPDAYPASSTESLDPELRTPALVRRLQKLDADILCLQEVEAEVFEQLTQALEGYQGRFLQRDAGHPDGCATLVRGIADPTWHELKFNDGGRGQADSGHVALTLECTMDDRRLAVANTHLKWDPPGVAAGAQWAARQMKQLIDTLKTINTEGTVVAGDFNAVARDEVVRLLRQAAFREAFDGERDSVYTIVTGKKPRKIDYLFHSARLRARPHRMGSLNAETVLPSEDEPSDHIPLVVDFEWVAGGRQKKL